jgi:hypothetical protein
MSDGRHDGITIYNPTLKEIRDMCEGNCTGCICKEADVALATVSQINLEIGKLEADKVAVENALKELEVKRKQLLVTQLKVDTALATLKHLVEK